LTGKLFFAMFTEKLMSRPVPSACLADLGTPPPAYQRLQDQLQQTSWVCQGTLVARPLLRRRAGRLAKKGPYYLWTCKVKGRTVCVALSKAQFQVLAEAMANQRRLQKTLQRMQALTFKTILRKVPGVQKRK
jgi:hypothetical protein